MVKECLHLYFVIGELCCFAEEIQTRNMNEVIIKKLIW